MGPNCCHNARDKDGNVTAPVTIDDVKLQAKSYAVKAKEKGQAAITVAKDKEFWDSQAKKVKEYDYQGKWSEVKGYDYKSKWDVVRDKVKNHDFKGTMEKIKTSEVATKLSQTVDHARKSELAKKVLG